MEPFRDVEAYKAAHASWKEEYEAWSERREAVLLVLDRRYNVKQLKELCIEYGPGRWSAPKSALLDWGLRAGLFQADLILMEIDLGPRPEEPELAEDCIPLWFLDLGTFTLEVREITLEEAKEWVTEWMTSAIEPGLQPSEAFFEAVDDDRRWSEF